MRVSSVGPLRRDRNDHGVGTVTSGEPPLDSERTCAWRRQRTIPLARGAGPGSQPRLHQRGGDQEFGQYPPPDRLATGPQESCQLLNTSWGQHDLVQPLRKYHWLRRGPPLTATVADKHDGDSSSSTI